jgi:glyoxylase-like metal-dependent hydrolase (beta-lactamase superfamily II)
MPLKQNIGLNSADNACTTGISMKSPDHSPQGIITITLPLQYRMGSVNCYLVSTGTGFILIDTGGSNGRRQLATAMRDAGCSPGDLGLIILTHGDFDHIGNAAWLREEYGARIAMHEDESGMAEHGDMFWNREFGNALTRVMARLFFRLGRSNRFQPDIHVEDGSDLSEHGFDATVLSIPGHSKGSIGILTADGDLFCGDLLDNRGKPKFSAIMDDATAAGASVRTLRTRTIGTVYPGHGKPFRMEEFKGVK